MLQKWNEYFGDLINMLIRNRLIIVIVAIGTLLRLYKLDFFDLWYDEVVSFIEILDINRLFLGIKSGALSPLYFILLNLWSKIAGTSVYSLRFLSAGADIVSIVLIYIAAKRCYDKKTGMLSALFFAVSPLYIWYAQEARQYSLSVMTSLLAVCICLELQKKQNTRLWFLFFSSLVMAFYLNYSALFLVVPCFVLLRKNIYSGSKFTWIGVFVFCLSLLPGFYLARSQLNNIIDVFWIPVPKLIDLYICLGNFFAGYNSTLPWMLAAICLSTGLVIAGIAAERRNAKTFFLIACGLFPVITVFLISQFIALFVVKILLPFCPYIYILAAKGLLAIRSRIVKSGLCLLLLIIMALSLNNYYKGRMPAGERFSVGVQPKIKIQKAVEFISENLQPNDIIAHSNAHTLYPFLYLFKDNQNALLMYLTIPEKQQDAYWKAEYSAKKKKNRQPLEQFSYRVNRLGNSDALYFKRRMWLVSSNWRVDGLLDPHALAVRKQAMLRFKKSATSNIDGMHIDLFEMDKQASPITGNKK